MKHTVFLPEFSVGYRFKRPGLRDLAVILKSEKTRARTRMFRPAFSVQYEKNCSAPRDAVGGRGTDHDQRGANFQGDIGCVRRGQHASLPDRGRESAGPRRLQQSGGDLLQTDPPAGQNVWACTAAGAPGTWNQMTAGASVVTGASAPGGTCTAGALYVRTDMQQFYICSATNTWQMAGYASNLLANRPLNCLAGQLFLATDAGTLWFCSTPGSPGTWQAFRCNNWCRKYCKPVFAGHRGLA